MDHRLTELRLKSPVASLCWNGDALVDWVGGNRVLGLDGSDSGSRVNWGFRFDAAVQSRCGRYAVIYERLGTKGLLLDRGKLVREINRSFYMAECYEYPIVLFEHDGRSLMAHCPDEYNRIEIDEVVSGKRLTGSEGRKPCDFFHSRLAVSPDQGRLVSAGWYWHPFSTAATWSIGAALADGRVLDELGPPSESIRDEVNSAVSIDAERLLVSSSPDDIDGKNGEPGFISGKLGVFNVATGKFEELVDVREAVGTMMWLGDGRVVGFFESPKIFDLKTGQALLRWPDIATAKQDSSIIHHLENLPPMALDPGRRRFAIAMKDRVAVVQL